jgi:hypothetical protein
MVALPVSEPDSTDPKVDRRVPVGVPHWVIVQSIGGADIVAQRMLTGADRQGVSYAMGIPVVAGRWLVPVGGAATVEASLVAVANPSATQTATVTLRRHGDGVALDIPGSTQTIRPGGRVVFDLGLAGLIGGANSVEVVSDAPVVVGQWMGFTEPRDIATPLGIPVTGTQSLPVDVMPPGVEPDTADPGALPADTTPIDTTPVDPSVTTGVTTGAGG